MTDSWRDHSSNSECTHLIAGSENVGETVSSSYFDNQKSSIPARITHRLYISHFLSTWNSRVFEFGAVLYLATIYSGTLLPMSIYALSRGLSAIIFASAVGHYIDVGDRLKVVRLSIGKWQSKDRYPVAVGPPDEVIHSTSTACCGCILPCIL